MFHAILGLCTCLYFIKVVHVSCFKQDDASLIVPAPGQYSGPAVSHQAAVHEVPKGTGHCGG